MIERPEWKSLTQIVGSEHVLTDPYNLDRYSGDALTPSRAFGAEAAFERLADLVVRPGSTTQVSQVLAWAQDIGTPVIPYGGGTGVMGGGRHPGLGEIEPYSGDQSAGHDGYRGGRRGAGRPGGRTI